MGGEPGQRMDCDDCFAPQLMTPSTLKNAKTTRTPFIAMNVP
jgi:hypothetical protein